MGNKPQEDYLRPVKKLLKTINWPAFIAYTLLLPLVLIPLLLIWAVRFAQVGVIVLAGILFISFMGVFGLIPLALVIIMFYAGGPTKRQNDKDFELKSIFGEYLRRIRSK